MSFETDIVARLRAAPGVTSIVGSRIYAGLAPQDAPLPRLTYFAIGGGDEVVDLLGASGLAEVRLQVDAWADRYSTIRALADAVRESLHMASRFGVVQLARLIGPAQISIEPPADGGQRGIRRARLDFRVSFQVTRVNRV